MVEKRIEAAVVFVEKVRDTIDMVVFWGCAAAICGVVVLIVRFFGGL